MSIGGGFLMLRAQLRMLVDWPELNILAGFPDSIPPTAISFEPVDSSIDVPVGTAITVTFSETVQANLLTSLSSFRG